MDSNFVCVLCAGVENFLKIAGIYNGKQYVEFNLSHRRVAQYS